jgi:hypothetical protein
MSGLLVRADGGFIWLIVGIFWVVAQIAGAAAKKKQPLRLPVGDDEQPVSTEDPPALSNVEGFAELLRKLAGADEFRVEPPQFEEAEEKPWKPGEIEALPEIQPLRREAPVPEPVLQKQEVSIRPTMSAFRNTLPAMKLPAMTLRFQPLEKSSGNFPTLGKIIDLPDRKALRRAMLSHILFSPPKALERT